MSDRGPLLIEDLATALRQAGVILSTQRLANLPQRYPEVFAFDGAGRLVAGYQLAQARRAGEDAPEAEDPVPEHATQVDSDEPTGHAWHEVPAPAPLQLDDIVVLHVADAAEGLVDIGAVRMRDGATAALSTGPGQSEALRQFVDGSAAVVGYGLDRVVTNADDLAAALPAVRIDLRMLALLHSPGHSSAGLSELCATLAIGLEGGGIVAQARAAADCVRILTEKVDHSDPSWQLARACLVAGGSDLARLVPAGSLPADASEGLRCADDPLLSPPAQAPEHRSAREGVRHVLSRLDELAFTPRRSQQEMAAAVAEVLDEGRRIAVEAPTGTGKSLAYLAAAAGRASRGRQPVVIATATKVLQQQLRRDVEKLQRSGLFGAPFRQLFGVGNYICAREVGTAVNTSEPDLDENHWLALAVAVRALALIPTGVWDDVRDHDVAATRPAYRAARDTLRTDAGSCERHDCDWVTRCPLYTRLASMRERPGVVVANHALVATWAKLAFEGRRSPGDASAAGASDLVFDEAHELEDSLTGAWTEAVGRRELLKLAARLDGKAGLDRQLRRIARIGPDLRRGRNLPALARQLRQACEDLSSAAHTYLHEYGGADDTAVMRYGIVQIRPEFRYLVERVRDVIDCLRPLTDALTAVESAARQATAGAPPQTSALLRSLAARAGGTAAAAEEATRVLDRLRELPDEQLWVYLLSIPATDENGRGDEPAAADWTFECIPIDVGEAFGQAIVRPARSVTLTSATLTTGGTFDFLASRLGIRIEPGSVEPEIFEGRQLASPFDHATQSAVVLTSHLPVPVPSQEREFVEDLARDQVGLLSLTGGRAMTLFAARRRMQAVAERVRARADELAGRGVQLLIQGEAGAAEIAQRFRSEPGTVVYGLRSYWQGFDAPGDTLSYLVIEKPPYPHVDDPVVGARARAIADRGGDPFLEYVVPKTAILLAQGFGRLIRTETDRGVALICDRRVQSPSAANQILLSTLAGPRHDGGPQIHHARDREDAWRYAIRFVTGDEPDLTAALELAGDDVQATVARLRLVDGEDPQANLREAAQLLFGIEQLRDAQLQLMVAHLRGDDALGILPTGAGKSLCFQLPALLRPEDRATVVVSPLVALIKDQLDDLRGRRRLRGVQGITANTPSSVRTEILRDLAEGKVRLLYVSPERLVRDPVLRVALESQDLAGLVVDEAHCVSAWGHDFRPEFRRVATAVAHLGRAPRLALTATAAPQVSQDIEQTLELADPVRVVRPADRPNLRFHVTRVAGERERARELLRIVTAMGKEPGIVYASRRAVTEEVAALLRRTGVGARHYHAGMVPEQREAVQDDFLAGTTQVIVATKAFGMGVNKPDIGWVVHYDLPESLDAYVQESGRAARDPALRGECVLLFSGGDVMRRRSQATDSERQTRLSQATRLLALLASARKRNGDIVFDADEAAEAVGVEPEELNVLLAWLERTDALVQRPDCSARGTVNVGTREPTDPDERRRFRELSVILNLRPKVASRIDFDRLQDERGLDPDDLERDLIAWSLDRLITFSSSRRYRRIRLLADRVDAAALDQEVGRWNAWQRRQLDAIISYAQDGGCRRSAMVAYFGFPAYACGPEHEPCDTCGGLPAWLDLPASAVPDPEHLVNVDLVALQAIAWATAVPVGRYGETGLKAAVLGVETTPGGHPLGAGLRRCPQFGALRYVRAADRRWTEAVDRLVGDGLVTREAARREQTAYTSLTITDAGRTRLGVRHV
ncbi:RecQ family ATP-dependent DNA helicase [Phytohabitans sp. LJ34]|uniref:RecQ family ATP-dependent DNA helicase n=1 Tax=Phytohabitans sp. LJ34 TaxID=3452217 RepID=UPI003F8B0B5C